MGEGYLWEDSSYCWVVVCKNNLYDLPRNIFHRHKIALAETEAVTSRPSLGGPFTVRCDICGKEYLYKPSDVLRLERELPDGFLPHPLFRSEAR